MSESDLFPDERRRTRRFFNLVTPFYPLVERHLWPEYRHTLQALDLPADFGVLDLATGTGMLAGAFSERGHTVTGLDFADGLLHRARRRFPQVDFRTFDLGHLERIGSDSYDLVCMGYLLHGLSPGFRRFVLRQASRIARHRVLVFDHGREGGWLVRLIEWVEGPNYPTWLAEDKVQELGRAALGVEREEPVSEFGNYWLCRPIG